LLIDGEWLKGEGRRTLPVINPATEKCSVSCRCEPS
jgi:acyl-CoA reductase-like NAD-dependent aldehyde dehydrogenase